MERKFSRRPPASTGQVSAMLASALATTSQLHTQFVTVVPPGTPLKHIDRCRRFKEEADGQHRSRSCDMRKLTFTSPPKQSCLRSCWRAAQRYCKAEHLAALSQRNRRHSRPTRPCQICQGSRLVGQKRASKAPLDSIVLSCRLCTCITLAGVLHQHEGMREKQQKVADSSLG